VSYSEKSGGDLVHGALASLAVKMMDNGTFQPHVFCDDTLVMGFHIEAARQDMIGRFYPTDDD
jgi:hypothetical protein